MNNQEATDLTEFLMLTLHENGFGAIENEIDNRIKEDFEEFGYLEPREKLIYILSETIQIFNSFSNRNYEGLLSRLNRHVEGHIEGIGVVLSPDGSGEPFDLKDLPDYTEISGIFEGILGEISNDKNNTDDIN